MKTTSTRTENGMKWGLHKSMWYPHVEITTEMVHNTIIESLATTAGDRNTGSFVFAEIRPVKDATLLITKWNGLDRQLFRIRVNQTYRAPEKSAEMKPVLLGCADLSIAAVVGIIIRSLEATSHGYRTGSRNYAEVYATEQGSVITTKPVTSAGTTQTFEVVVEEINEDGEVVDQAVC